VFTIVVLTENALTSHDVDRLAHLHDPDPVRLQVLVPVGARHNRIVEALDDVALGRLGRAVRGSEEEAAPETAEVEARTSLDSSIRDLRLAGIEADGALAADDVVAAVAQAVRDLGADEVIVVTEPHLVEESLHRDWASKIREAVDLPVLHIVAGTDRVVS
jgi:hypothetical protein